MCDEIGIERSYGPSQLLLEHTASSERLRAWGTWDTRNSQGWRPAKPVDVRAVGRFFRIDSSVNMKLLDLFSVGERAGVRATGFRSRLGALLDGPLKS